MFGVIAHGYAQSVTVVTQLASLPIFLARWDLETYGQWLIILALPAYLSISDVGLLTAAANLMSMHQARNNTAEVNRVFNSSLAAILVLVPLITIVVGALLLAFSFGLTLDQRIALFVMIVSALLTVACGLFDAAYRPFGKYPRVTFLLTTTRVIEWSGSIAGLFIGGTLTSAAIGMLVGRAASCLGMIALARRDIPQIRINLRTADMGVIRQLLASGVGFLAFPFGTILAVQGMLLVVGARLGGAAVTVFGSTRTLTRLLMQIGNLTSRSMAPEISALYGAGNEERVTELTSRLHWKIVGITIAAALVLWPLGPTIFRIWGRGKLEFNGLCFTLLLIAAVLSSFWQIRSVRLTATNRHSFLAVIFAVVSALALLLAYLTEGRFGINAAAACACLVELAMIVGTTIALRRLGRPGAGDRADRGEGAA
jgi:O-antigen/teichoic acid export membrane protein